MHPDLVTDEQGLAAVVAAVREAGAFALDLEFVPEGRYLAELALVQVAWGDVERPEARAIDPLAINPAPLFALAGDPAIDVILHAAQADLAILAGGFGIAPTAVWDTQTAAAFLGYGDQVGYAALVQRVLGVVVGKGSQFTDWLKRPLTESQLEYALDDVRYLPALWARLRADLEARNRLDWVAEECQRQATSSDGRPQPDDAYRRVKGWRRLNRREIGSLRALAAWREHEARRRNRPPGHVLGERQLLELARSRVRSVEDMREIRGLPEGLIKREGAQLLETLLAGAADPPPAEPGRAPMETHTEVWATVLQGLVRSAAVESGVAPRFIASRDDIEELTRWWEEGDRAEEPALPLLSGWRRALVGEEALRWLRGDSVLVADREATAGLRFIPLPPGER